VYSQLGRHKATSTSQQGTLFRKVHVLESFCRKKPKQEGTKAKQSKPNPDIESERAGFVRISCHFDNLACFATIVKAERRCEEGRRELGFDWSGFEQSGTKYVVVPAPRFVLQPRLSA
jgi:hypothetical protein